MATIDPKTRSYLVSAAVIAVVLIVAYYLGSNRQSFSILRGANTHEEEAALSYYRNMVCMGCPDDPTKLLFQRWSGSHCSGRLAKPLVVLHSDGDRRIEDIFAEATHGLNIVARVVGGRPPTWVHDTPSIWCFGGDSLYRYSGEMCVDGIRQFATGMYAAEWIM